MAPSHFAVVVSYSVGAGVVSAGSDTTFVVVCPLLSVAAVFSDLSGTSRPNTVQIR